MTKAFRSVQHPFLVLLAVGALFISAASAQSNLIGSSFGGAGQSITSDALGGGEAGRMSDLTLQGLTAPTTWSTPALPEQRPLFAPVDEVTYVVGPGDHFHVGTGVKFFNVMVGPEGYVVIEGVPPIAVTGLTLKETRALMVDRLARHFRREAIQVRLSEAKRFQVLVAGSVARPGLQAMDYGARVTQALDAAGGFSPRAERRLTLKRANGETQDLDLRGFFTDGDLSQNPMLQQGDRILAPAIQGDARLVYVREGANMLSVPYQDGESVENFVLRYDNFRDGRVWRAVRLYDSAGRYVTEISRERAAATPMPAGATVEIQHSKGIIFIGGMVLRPGTLEYSPTMTAMDYLALAGITVGTSDVRRIDVLGSDGRKRRVNVTRDALRPGDHILVPRSFEATFRDHIAIISAISSLAVAIATFVVLTGE